MIAKNTWNLGQAKIYESISLENPIVVGSPQGISEIYKFINELQVENKKLREALETSIEGLFISRSLLREYGFDSCADDMDDFINVSMKALKETRITTN
jgi:hypothetical protein